LVAKAQRKIKLMVE